MSKVRWTSSPRALVSVLASVGLLASMLGWVGLSTLTADAATGGGYVGNRVWDDLNGNGIQDSGEPGLGNVPISLIDARTGRTVAAGRTSSGGWYGFRGLDESKCYRVQAQTIAGYEFTDANQGSSDTKDSDANTSTGLTGWACLDRYTNQYWWDIGLTNGTTPPTGNTDGYTGNRVFRDLNGNGVQDSGEPGLANARVTLTNSSTGATVASGRSSSGGWFGFRNLNTGSCYELNVTADGFIPTVADFGDDSRDSDAGPDGSTGEICLNNEAEQNNWDVGLVPTEFSTAPQITINAHLFWDANENGTQDLGETDAAFGALNLQGPSDFPPPLLQLVDQIRPEDNGDATITTPFIEFDDGVFVSETIMAPRTGATAEDDGYLITFASDIVNDISDCYIVDAARVGDGPIAKIRLPERISSGTHSTWAPAADLAAAGVAIGSASS